jgi:hypothetical protein
MASTVSMTGSVIKKDNRVIIHNATVITDGEGQKQDVSSSTNVIIKGIVGWDTLVSTDIARKLV